MNVTVIELEFVELPHTPVAEPAGINNGYLLSMWDCTCCMARWNTATQRFEDSGGLLNPRAIRSWALLPKPLDFPTWGNAIVQAAVTGSTEYEGAGWLEPAYANVDALPNEQGGMLSKQEESFSAGLKPSIMGASSVQRSPTLSLLNVSIIPADPGYQLIYMQDDGPELSGTVLAWRISTYETPEGGGVRSEVEPLEVMGEPGANFVGVKHPDGSVSILQDTEYSTWEEYCEHVKHRRAS